MDINTLEIHNVTIMNLLLACAACMFTLMLQFVRDTWAGRNRVEIASIGWNGAMASIGWNG